MKDTKPLRIGAIGHRLNKLQNTECKVLNQAIRDAVDGLASTDRDVVVISSLAEGADRLIAAEAVEVGYNLAALLPFPAATFVADFDGPGSLEEFHQLLGQADEVVELPGKNGSHDERGAAFTVAAKALADRSDALIAIWDGAPADGPGGTAAQVEHAIAHGKPVLWIDSRHPHKQTLLGPVEFAPFAWQQYAAGAMANSSN